jgi:hypothetical protein
MTSVDKLAAEPRIVVRHEAAIDPRGRCVVYRMRRTQRALDNPVLETCAPQKHHESSCSAGQEAVLIVKSLQDGVRHHAAGPVEAMPLALHLRGAMLARSRKTGS